MKSQILDFLNNLILYDYILFGASFIVFILLIVLALVLRRKIVLAIILILVAFSIVFLAPSVFYNMMHQYLFKSTVELHSHKKLQYTNAMVVYGVIKNESKFHFSQCKINVKVHKVSKNTLKNFLWQFKSMKNMSIVEYDIEKGQSRDFKIIVEPFSYSKEYNLTLGAECR